MVGIRAYGQDASGDVRMQGLDPSVEHFRESREFRDFLDVEPCFAQDPGRAPGRYERGTGGRQRPGEFNQSRLVGDAKERPSDLWHIRPL